MFPGTYLLSFIKIGSVTAKIFLIWTYVAMTNVARTNIARTNVAWTNVNLIFRIG